MRGEFFLASGLFLYAKSFDIKNMQMRTEISELATLYAAFAKVIAGDGVHVEVREVTTTKGSVYHADVTEQLSRELIIQKAANPDALADERDIGAFLSGVFLACGSTINPDKRYRLDFAPRMDELCDKLIRLLKKRGFSPAVAERRGKSIIYISEREQIQDFFTIAGASRAALRVIDTEMIKQVRNHANRVTNIETANIDKQVDTAMKQVRDIEIVLREVGAEGLSEQLRRAAELRLEHPEASLRDLVALSPEPITRSGLFHRYAAIAKMAQEIRKDNGV